MNNNRREKSIKNRKKSRNNDEKKYDRLKNIFKPMVFPESLCPVCGKKIKNITESIPDKRSLKPAHFSCSIKYLEERENIASDEKIIYIGNRFFAVVKKRDYAKGQFNIVKKISFSDDDDNIWRKEMRVDVE